MQAFVSGQSVVSPTGHWAPNHNETERRRSDELRRSSSSRSSTMSSVGEGDADPATSTTTTATAAKAASADGLDDSVVLAERTSNLINSYRDYISGQDDEEMLRGNNNTATPPGRDVFHRRSQQQQQHQQPSSAPLLRDWNARPYSSNSSAVAASSHTSRCEMELDELFDDPFSDCQRKSYRYAHPIYHSKKFKRFVALGALFVGVATVGWLVVESGKSHKMDHGNNSVVNLPDWEGELKEELQKEKEKEEAALVHKKVVDNLQQEAEKKKGENGGNPTANVVAKTGAMAAYDDAEFSAIEAITRNILCCSSSPDDNNDQSQEVDNPSSSGNNKQAMEFAHAESYHPRWYNRSHGWEGTTYQEALAFCASQTTTTAGNTNEASQLCPYDVYCPMGTHHIPLGGYQGHESDVEAGNNSRAPIADYPNGWVRVGSDNSCVQYTVLDPSDDIGSLMKGSGGVSGAEAMLDEIIGKQQAESESVENEGIDQAAQVNVDQEVASQEDDVNENRQDEIQAASASSDTKQEDDGAPSEQTQIEQQSEEVGLVEETYVAIKPEGPSAVTEELVAKKEESSDEKEKEQEQAEASEEAVQNDAFLQQQMEEQAAKLEASQEVSQNQESAVANTETADVTTSTNTVVTNNAQKNHPQQPNLNSILHTKYKPMWLTPSEGWISGSHADATNFCNSIRGKQLCPYAAMCPEGPGGIVMGGRHALEFKVEGVQYAPVLGKENHWVMIGDNEDRCKTHRQLEGKAPAWGVNGDRKEVKQYVMCCTV